MTRLLTTRVPSTFVVLFLGLCGFALLGCPTDRHHDDDHSHGDDHGHGDEHSHGDDETHSGEDFDEGHSHGGDDSWAVTAWGEVFEIFAEAGPLAVGERSSSHTHVTLLEGFLPLEEGTVAAVLRSVDGAEAVFLQDTPVRSGIYDVAIVPERPGDHELVFRVTTPSASEDVSAGRVRVGSSDDPGGPVESPDPAAGGSDEPISFLKEQQWRVPFATAWVGHGEIAEAVRGLGRVRPRAGGEILLTAPVDAVVQDPGVGRWPYPGLKVSAGTRLFRLAPRLGDEPSLAKLEAQVQVLAAELQVARERQVRLDQLLEVAATSRREATEAQAKVAALDARLKAARSDLSTVAAARRGGAGGGSIGLDAPLTGTVAEVTVSPGQAVDAGAVLARVVRTDPLWLEVRLRPADAARLTGDPAGLELDLAGRAEQLVLTAGEVRLISRFPEIDPATGTVGALLEIPGSSSEITIGSAIEAAILLPQARSGVVVPASALVDDGGVAVVYVQLDGESFVRREVEARARQGGRVLVEGLTAGERLVTRGGSAIRRSTLIASGGGDHGHIH